jgi:hypothetical protein
LGKQSVEVRAILKTVLKEELWKRGLDSSGPGQSVLTAILNIVKYLRVPYEFGNFLNW